MIKVALFVFKALWVGAPQTWLNIEQVNLMWNSSILNVQVVFCSFVEQLLVKLRTTKVGCTIWSKLSCESMLRWPFTIKHHVIVVHALFFELHNNLMPWKIEKNNEPKLQEEVEEYKWTKGGKLPKGKKKIPLPSNSILKCWICHTKKSLHSLKQRRMNS